MVTFDGLQTNFKPTYTTRGKVFLWRKEVDELMTSHALFILELE